MKNNVKLIGYYGSDLIHAQSAFTHPDFGKYKIGSTAYYNEYKDGYNKAKKKYKYTEEDISVMVNNAVVFAESNTHLSVGEYATQFKDFYNKCIQSLNLPKIPIAFESEIQYFYMSSKYYYGKEAG